MEHFIVGEFYNYSRIPKFNTEEIEVNIYGEETLGRNAIHIREHESGIDVWFIFIGMKQEGVYQCVYND